MFLAGVLVVVLPLLVVLALAVVHGIRARRARRDDAAWQKAFAERGGSRQRFSGYEQDKGAAAKRADQERYLRRFRRAMAEGRKVKKTKSPDAQHVTTHVVNFHMRGQR